MKRFLKRGQRKAKQNADTSDGQQEYENEQVDYEETISTLKSLATGSFGDPGPVLARIERLQYTQQEALEVYDLVLQIMQKFSYERITQECAVDCLQRMLNVRDRSWLSPEARQRTTRTLLEIIDKYRQCPSLIQDSFMVLYQFNLPTDCGEDFYNVIKLSIDVIWNPNLQYKSLRKMAIEVLRLSSSQATPVVKEEMRKLGVLKTMVKLINLKMEKQVKSYGLEIEWMTAWSLVEGVPANAIQLVEVYNGVQLFMDNLKTFGYSSELAYYVTGILSTVVMVHNLRSYFRRCKELLLKLLEVLRQKQIAFDVESAIVEVMTFLVSDGKDVWEKDIRNTISREKILDIIESKIDLWQISCVRQRAYQSLAPLLDLLLVEHTPECQYWASWAMANRFYHEGKRYSKLLDEDGGCILIEEILGREQIPPKIAHHLKIVLSSYHKTKHGITTITMNGFSDNMDSNQHHAWEDSDYWNSSSSHSLSESDILLKNNNQARNHVIDPALSSKKKHERRSKRKHKKKQNRENFSFIMNKVMTQSRPAHSDLSTDRASVLSEKSNDDVDNTPKHSHNKSRLVNDYKEAKVNPHRSSQSNSPFQRCTPDLTDSHQYNHHPDIGTRSCSCSNSSHSCSRKGMKPSERRRTSQHRTRIHNEMYHQSVVFPKLLQSHENVSHPDTAYSTLNSQRSPTQYQGDEIIIQIHSRPKSLPLLSPIDQCGCHTPLCSRAPSSYYQSEVVSSHLRSTSPKPSKPLSVQPESPQIYSSVKHSLPQSKVEPQINLLEEQPESGTEESLSSCSQVDGDDRGYLDLDVRQASELLPVGADTYDTTTTPRGLVYIFNFLDFNGRHSTDVSEERREGSQFDVANLDSLFTQMGYEIHIIINLTRDEFKDKLENIRKCTRLQEVGSLIFFMLSHGYRQHTMITSDMDYVTVKHIQDQFTDVTCPYMKGKPKLFFFAISKGPNLPKWMQTTRWESVRHDGKDTVSVFSSSKKFNAERAKGRGTTFIRTLCKIFAEHSATKNLSELLDFFKTIYNINIKVYNAKVCKEFYFNPKTLAKKES